MKVPLCNRLKKQIHRDTAMLQDELVEVVYNIAPKAVLHGGTAIWRCYSGNRFSEDIDFYLKKSNKFKQSFIEEIKAKNLSLLKYKETGNTIFSRISNGVVEVRLEANFGANKKYEVKSYEKANGSSIDVFTLSAEELITEKISAYTNRKLIRDFYDIYFLSGIARENSSLHEKLRNFLEKTEKPLDEKNLRTVIYSGAIPSFGQMLEVLKWRFQK